LRVDTSRSACENRRTFSPPGRCEGTGVMAKTAKQQEWTPERLREAVVAGSQAEKVELLKEIGVLTKHGKLAKSSERWGKKPSRTPVLEK
jgi:hypothetical protein